MAEVQIPGGSLKPEILSDENLEPVNVEGVCSQRCDLFSFTSEDVARYRKAGKRIDHVRLSVYRNGECIKIPGMIPIESATSEWILQNHGPGLYEVQGCTSEGGYVKRTRVSLGGANGAEAGAAVPGVSPWAPPRPPAGGALGQFQEMVQLLALLKSTGLLGAPAAAPDSMKEIMASMMAASHQTQQMIQGLMAQQIAALQATKPADGLILELIKQGKNNGGGGNAADMLAVLKIGAELASKATGGKASAEKPTDTELVLDMLRPMIGPLGALMVHTMPPEQRPAFMKILEAQAAALAAEEAADEAGSP